MAVPDSPIYETNLSFEDIDKVIRKIYPVIATEHAPTVIAALISLIVMSMNPGAPAAEIIKQIEDISQFITMNIMTPPSSEGGPTLN